MNWAFRWDLNMLLVSMHDLFSFYVFAKMMMIQYVGCWYAHDILFSLFMTCSPRWWCCWWYAHDVLFSRPVFTPDQNSFLYFSNKINRKSHGKVRISNCYINIGNRKIKGELLFLGLPWNLTRNMTLKFNQKYYSEI